MYQVIINVIPKSGREGKILPDIIHYNQTGFIQNRSLTTNISTCISLIHYAKKQKLDLTLMTVDAVKAFY